MSIFKIWIAEEVKEYFDLISYADAAKFYPIKNLLLSFMKEAGVDDLLILPYFPAYIRLVTKIRQYGIIGPIIFIIKGYKNIAFSFNILKNGVLFLNHERLGKNEITSVINFLLDMLLKKINISHSKRIEKEKKVVNSDDYKVNDIQSINNFIQRHIDDSFKEFDDMDDRRKAVFLLEKFKNESRTLIFSFETVYQPGKKPIAFNLTSEISGIIGNKHIVLGSIRPRLDDLSNLIKQGDTLSLFFDFGNKYYTCRCTLNKIRDNEVIVVDFPKEIKIQQRKHIRVNIDKRDNTIFHIKFTTLPTTEIEIIDLSESGLSFKSFEEIEIGLPFIGHLKVNDNNLLFNGEIKNRSKTKTDFRYGAAIILDEFEIKKILKFILKKQAEMVLNNYR